MYMLRHNTIQAQRLLCVQGGGGGWWIQLVEWSWLWSGCHCLRLNCKGVSAILSQTYLEIFGACIITQIVPSISPKRLQKVKFLMHALKALCIFIVMFNYSYCYVYAFLLLCMFSSVYSVSLCCSMYCLYVNVYRTTATGCQPNCS